MKLRNYILLIICLVLAPGSYGRELPRNAARRIDALLESGLKNGYYPGAVVIVGNSDGITYERYVGHIDSEKSGEVKAETLYDLASVTKVVSTTFAAMKLYEQGHLDLNKRVGHYVNTYDGSEIENIPVSQLLTHTSGLPFFAIYPLVFKNSDGGRLVSTKPDAEKYPFHVDKNCYLCAKPQADERFISSEPRETWRRAGPRTYVNPNIDTLINSTIRSSYRPEMRGKYRYSDTNLQIVREIIEHISGTTIEEYTAALYRAVKMNSTGYRPLEWAAEENIAPTEIDHLMQRGLLRGYPHDEYAAVSRGGAGGHAGLFSTGRDLALFCKMLLNEGWADENRILDNSTIHLFTSSPLSPQKIYRGLGFDKRAPESDLANGYGHTGYTGTMIWIDPERDLFMVFLCNRVNPSRLNTGLNDSSLRTQIWSVLKETFPARR